MSYFILISKIPDVKLQYGRKLWIVCLYCMGDQNGCGILDNLEYLCL